MLLTASWAISSRIHGLFQRFAPSNIVIRRVHTRPGIKWGPLVGLGGVVVYGLLMIVTGTVVRDGGPGWATLFMLVGFWNTVRFAVLIPVSTVLLLGVRHHEKRIRRDQQQRASSSSATPACEAAGRGPASLDESTPPAAVR